MREPKLRSADSGCWCPEAATGPGDAFTGSRAGSTGDTVNGSEASRSSRVEWLRAAAAPVLDELVMHLRDSSLCVALADKDSVIIDTRYTDQQLARVVERIGVVPAGTSTVDVPAARHGSRGEDGAERQISCYRRPIQHPLTREVVGVLVITVAMSQANPLFVPFLRHAVRDIEKRLVDATRADEQSLLAAFRQAVNDRANAVAVLLNGKLALTTPEAADLLGPADHAALRRLAGDVPDGRSVTRSLQLTSGLVVAVEASRLTGTTGTMFWFSWRLRRGGDDADGFGVERRLRRLRGTHCPVVISGELGAGRSHAARVVAGGAPIATLDVAEVPAIGEAAWAGRLEELASRNDDGVIAIEEIQLLPATLCARLATVLAESSARFVLTSTPHEDLPSYVANLASSCMYRVELPPLRRRRDELPALVQAIASVVRPELDVWFTSGALAALSAHQWQGNLRELAMVVRYALASSTTAEITAADLPEAYRTPAKTRPLTPWQQAERDAIISALRATSGNKLRAAGRLGISRSTLYNRIRALEITV